MVHKILVAALIAVFLGLCAANSQAHYLWLERDGDGPARAFFGEYANDRYEKAGGLLDRFTNLQAFLASPKEMLNVEKRSDRFDVVAKGAGDLRAFDDTSRPAPIATAGQDANHLLRQSGPFGN